MNLEAIADAARDKTVTAERLSESVLATLAPGEQPHYLLCGMSLDVERDTESERIFAALDETARAVISDRRLVVHVPHPTGDRVETVAFEAITSIDATEETPKRLLVETEDARLRFNAAATEAPGRFAAALRNREPERTKQAATTRTPESAGRTNTTSIPAAGDGGGTTDTAESRPVVGDGAGDTGKGGRPSDHRTDPTAQQPSEEAEAGPMVRGDDDRSRGRGETVKMLRELADLYDRGVLTHEEFEAKKQDLLSDI
jgi:hypothetical protein